MRVGRCFCRCGVVWVRLIIFNEDIVTRQRQASGFVAARLGSDMVVGTYVGKEVGV
jgi:hypothetical protein